MQIIAVALLTGTALLLMFPVIGLGHLFGNLTIAGIKAGPVIGAMLTALLFGYLSFNIPPGASAFGFALLICPTGITTGPTIFRALTVDAAKYFALAVIVSATPVALTASFAQLIANFDLGMRGLPAGLFVFPEASITICRASGKRP